jgi:hypothetical protein
MLSVWQATDGDFLLLSLSTFLNQPRQQQQQQQQQQQKLPSREAALVVVGVFGDRRQHFGSHCRFASNNSQIDGDYKNHPLGRRHKLPWREI